MKTHLGLSPGGASHSFTSAPSSRSRRAPRGTAPASVAVAFSDDANEAADADVAVAVAVVVGAGGVRAKATASPSLSGSDRYSADNGDFPSLVLREARVRTVPYKA